MGDIVKNAHLSAIDLTGDIIGTPADYRALVDTGATCTVVSRKVASSIGAPIIRNKQRLGGRPVPSVLIGIELEDECPFRLVLAAVSDAFAKKASPEADIILGHDYLQKTRAVLRYDVKPHAVKCPRTKYRKRK